MICFLSVDEDYTPTIEVLTFTSAPSQECVNITISNDAVVEQQETFGVRLSTTDQSVSLTQDEATVIINDDTGREIQGTRTQFIYMIDIQHKQQNLLMERNFSVYRGRINFVNRLLYTVIPPYNCG